MSHILPSIFRVLTFMSLLALIDDLVSSGRLLCLPSSVFGTETARTMYVSTELHDDVTGSHRSVRDQKRFAEVRATLDAFSEGAEFSVSEDPYAKPSHTMLARVDAGAAEIWDIRVIAPRPGIRVFGCFAARDTFVALTWNFRENLDGPEGWDEEIEDFKRAWRELFGATEPFKGRSLDEYLTTFI